jgi:hypothetical protein
MTDTERQATINAWIDGWIIRLNDRAKLYREEGWPPDIANDRATFDIRMEIRRSPALDLGDRT